jgi:hypothetical protein
MSMPTPHLEKLTAALKNEKLPDCDRPRIGEAVEVYNKWITDMGEVEGEPDQVAAARVDLLNQYKLFMDLNVIFDSEEDFLYRQKGQLKLDNSIGGESYFRSYRACPARASRRVRPRSSAASRSAAIAAYLGCISWPRKRRPRRRHATPVVPEPQ